MTKVDFRALSPRRRARMIDFINAWRRSTASLPVLEESLMLLSSPSRPRAYQLAEEGGRPGILACTYGEGPVPKLALSKEDAGRLLTIVDGVKSAFEGKRSPPRNVLAEVLSAVINGEESSKGGKVRKSLMKVLANLVETAKQCQLF